MFAVFTHSLRRSASAIIGWGLSLGLLGYFLIGFYDVFADQSVALDILIAQYPPELMAFFGDLNGGMFTPEGFLTLEFFSYMPLVIGIFAVQAGSGLIVTDEESGTLDLTLAHPVSRSALFLGRLLAHAVTLVAILGVTWLAFFIGGEKSVGLDLTAGELVLPFVSLFAVLFLFSGLSLFLSLILPSRSLSTMISGLLLTASYFIQSFSNINADLIAIAKYLPLQYYQSGGALNGLNTAWVAGLIGFGLLFSALGWMLFVRRDIRVSGEGSWRLPFIRKVNLT